jgi:hypothetical protein
MPAVTVPKDALALGPGFLFYASPGSSLPANTVAGSVFTDNWPGAWLLFGVTAEGSEFDYGIQTSPVTAAEYLDVLKYATTGRSGSIKAALMQIHATNMKRACNGGIITVTGSGATQLNSYTPPPAGAEQRAMIGWESTDGDERIVVEQALQTGSLAIQRKKGADNARIPIEFSFEVPTSTFPFRYYTAGATRG